MAINMGQYASSILRQAKGIADDPEISRLSPHERSHFGVEPMLLALAMEFALKAWWVFDHDDSKVPKTHNLLTIFKKLTSESQEKLAKAYQRDVAPYHPDFGFLPFEIRDILDQHANAFIEWRYIHERSKAMSFETTHFVDTLESVLREFRKRYRIETVSSPWHQIKTENKY